MILRFKKLHQSHLFFPAGYLELHMHPSPKIIRELVRGWLIFSRICYRF